MVRNYTWVRMFVFYVDGELVPGFGVVGLLVAVPSLFAYNWLAQRIRHATMEMESFAEEFASAIEHNYVTN